MELFVTMSLEFLGRWLHIWFGIIWIGTLYYFNFMQTPFMAEADAATKPGVVTKLLPRALWWFRWGAMFTFLTGLVLFYVKYWSSMTTGTMLVGAGGAPIFVGVSLGILMFLNVWLIIWPKQQVVMANANAVAAGQPANPKAADAAARAGVASRTNTLFSIPLLFFMVAAGHHPFHIREDAGSLKGIILGVIFAVILGVEANAIWGKMQAPLKTVNAVITSGFVMLLAFLILFATISAV